MGHVGREGDGVALHEVERLVADVELQSAGGDDEVLAGTRRVRLGVFEFNVPAIRLYKKLGFKDDGSCGSHWVDGRFYVVNAMEIDVVTWARMRSTFL